MVVTLASRDIAQKFQPLKPWAKASRRTLGSLTALALVSASLVAGNSVPAHAAACGSGTAYSGSGTSGDPYEISEAAHLIYLSQTSADWSGKYFEQTANIDLEDCEFSPIGEHAGGFGPYFTGTYDGGGNTISGLKISHSDAGEFAGLFGATTGNLTVKNLGLEEVTVSSTGGEAVGAVLGYANVGSGSVIIQNTYVSGTVTGDASTYAGGLLGQVRVYGSGTVTLLDSYSTVAVGGGLSAGGLVGDANNGTLAITNVYAAGTVTREGGAGPQGLIGNRSGGDSVDLRETESFWDTEATGAATGWPVTPDIGEAKTTDEMSQLATFASWDIVDGWEAYDFETPTNEWGICSGVNDGYPFLLWQFSEDPCAVESGGSTGGSSQASASVPGVPGIYLTVQARSGDKTSGSVIGFGGYSVAPNAPYLLTIQLVEEGLPQTVLARGVMNSGGHLEDEVVLGTLSPGSYKIVFVSRGRTGTLLTLANVLAVDREGRFQSITPEALQPRVG